MADWKKTEQLYEGKAKKVYATENPEVVIVDYKDDATAFNGEKKGTIVGKGVINNRMSNYIMKQLEEAGVPTHLVEELSDRETAVKKVSIVPLEVIVRNVAAGSFSKRMGVEEGKDLLCPILEFSYKCDELNDPFINDDYALALGLATQEEIDTIKDYTRKVNEFLKKFFWLTVPSFWQTRSLRIPAVCGMSRPTKSWTRTVFAEIWAVPKRLIRKL